MDAQAEQVLLAKLKTLPPERRAQVEDFIDFLQARPGAEHLAEAAACAGEHTSWHKGVMNRLSELVQLQRGWDGYKAEPVSFENATIALRMLAVACGIDAPAPQIVPGTAGDLQIEWHTPKGDIELHIKGPDDVQAWRATPNGDPDGEEIPLANNFAIVAGWIKELAEKSSASKSAAA